MNKKYKILRYHNNNKKLLRISVNKFKKITKNSYKIVNKYNKIYKKKINNVN